jgi:hypothetical protein
MIFGCALGFRWRLFGLQDLALWLIGELPLMINGFDVTDTLDGLVNILLKERRLGSCSKIFNI